ncbi:Protein kinase domain-containing protein [Mycena kentingensis (nom. inval.)]|nr:Protein kinase domain-containing protein [Mycena kentingensis (nom. inval.)]
MRLAPTLLLSALAASYAHAAHNVPTRFQNRDIAPSRVVDTRALDLSVNARDTNVDLESRDLNDVLKGVINLCVVVPPLLLNILNLVIANAKLCLCLHGLDLYLNAQADVNLQQQAIARIKALVNADRIDLLPPNAVRVCVPGRPGINQYTCAKGYVLCNKKCILGTTCPATSSNIPRAVKQVKKITSLDEARAHCGPNFHPCGSATSPDGIECVDITSDFDSCGGCVIPPPFTVQEPRDVLPRGQECGAIRNARHVSCHNSKCVVQNCRRGYTVTAEKDGCYVRERDYRKTRRDLVASLPGPVSGAGVDPAGAASTLDPALAGQVADVVNSAGAINSAIGSASDASAIPAAVTDASNAVNTALTTTDPTQLGANVASAIDATKAAQSAVGSCGCGPDILSGLLDNLIKALGGLLAACPNGHPPTVPAPQSCLVVVATNVVCEILPSVYIAPIFVCGLGKLGELVQNIINPLGLGPQLIPSPTCLSGIAHPAPNGVPPPLSLPAAAPPPAGQTTYDPSLTQPLADVMNAAGAVNTAAGGAAVPGQVTDAANAVNTALNTADPSQLGSNVASAIDATKAAQAAIKDCGCGPDVLSGLLDGLLSALGGLLNACPDGQAPTVPAQQSCLVAIATNVVCEILPGVYVAPIVLCGLGPSLNGLVQPILNGLGLGLQAFPYPTCLAGIPHPAPGGVPPPIPVPVASPPPPVALPAPVVSAPAPPPVQSASPTTGSDPVVVAPSPPPSAITINLLGLCIKLGLAIQLGGPSCSSALATAADSALSQPLGLGGAPLYGAGGPLDVTKTLPGTDVLSGLTGGGGGGDLLGGLTGALGGVTGGGGDPLSAVTGALGGVTGGGGDPLSTVTNVLGGGGNPLGTVTDALGGVTGGGGDPLSAVTGALGGVTGGGGDPLSTVTGALGGVTGGGASGGDLLSGLGLGGLLGRQITVNLGSLPDSCDSSAVDPVTNLLGGILGAANDCGCGSHLLGLLNL